MSVVIGLKKGHLWQGWKLERDSWLRGQSSNSIEPMWREVLILAQRTATLSKGLYLFTTATHMIIIHYIHIYCNHTTVLLIFFSSAG
jgi:hypothetical protein